MADTMKAAVMHAVGDLRIDELPKPEVTSPDEALIRVDAVGICGSDVHWLFDGHIGDLGVEEPLVLGHEAAGTVVTVGDDVTRLQPGDRVAIEPGYTCRKCRYCKRGLYNLCPDVVFMATPPVDGAFCEFVTWPANFLFKLPEHVTTEEGAMIEPLSVGLWAAKRAGVQPGDVVAILGAGPIGLTTMQAAAAHGATTLVITDVVPSRLEFAAKLGATRIIHPLQEDVVEIVRELTDGEGADVCFECSGLGDVVPQAIALTRRGGMVQFVGMGPSTIDQFPIWDFISKELNAGGLFRYANCYPVGVALIAAGRVDVKSLITHHFSLNETAEAMEFVHNHKDQVIKAVIHP